MRKPIVVGNWKMNKTPEEAVQLVKELKPLVAGIEAVEIGVCPPFVCLTEVNKLLKGTNIGLGAQNMYWEPEGAYTGEISAEMLLTSGCRYVILGHSERRTYFGETNATVHRKLEAALQSRLCPIVCVGETREQREAGKAEQVVADHLRGAYEGISGKDAQDTVIAYEPVWAIGTGLTATPEQAQEMHAFIRKVLTELYSDSVAQRLRIQYGGSMKPGNAKELLAQKDIDGGLIGGAALQAESFAAIIKGGF
ncbi:MAG: triose-phosphate isomerase [Candidatus Latescibacterota bacterium]|nr:MAG: triose-phosphate isomerase [Candidatus Latescibacterota bacterium]